MIRHHLALIAAACVLDVLRAARCGAGDDPERHIPIALLHDVVMKALRHDVGPLADAVAQAWGIDTRDGFCRLVEQMADDGSVVLTDEDRAYLQGVR